MLIRRVICSNVQFAHLRIPYLNVIVSVVVKIEHPVNFGISVDFQVIDVLVALGDCLSRVLLHLDVVELPEDQKKINY